MTPNTSSGTTVTEIPTTGTTTRVTRHWFHTHIDPPGHYTSLDDMVEQLLADPIERATINHLYEQLATAGTFAQPLIIDRDQLIDGCHRYCAHIIADSTHIDIQYSDTLPEADTFVSLTYTLRQPARPDDHDAIDVARSFPVHPHGWATAEILTYDGHKISGTYTLDGATLTDAVAAGLNQLAQWGLYADITRQRLLSTPVDNSDIDAPRR